MFRQLTTDELIKYVKEFKWTRKIKQLHIHHAYEPSHNDFVGNNGIELQDAMKRYHVNTKRWDDIGQHLTLLPDGNWVTGRDFNIDPASIKGWNQGAFAIEMVGNFDKGHDSFIGKQAEEMFRFCRFFCEFEGLDLYNEVRFHRDNPTAGKSCPGTSIDKAWFINQIKTAGLTPKQKYSTAELVNYLNGKTLTNVAYWQKESVNDINIYCHFVKEVEYIRSLQEQIKELHEEVNILRGVK